MKSQETTKPSVIPAKAGIQNAKPNPLAALGRGLQRLRPKVSPSPSTGRGLG